MTRARGFLLGWFLAFSFLANADEEIRGPNGLALHGQQAGISSEGLRFRFGGAELPLPWSAVSHLIFRPGDRPADLGGQEIRLRDGGFFVGQVIGLSAETLEVEASFGARLRLPRASVLSLHRRPEEAATIYRGPTRADEWQVGDRGDNWQFEAANGQEPHLWTAAYASTGLDARLPERAVIEFDLALRNQPTVNVTLCADNGHDGGRRFYYLQVNASQLTVRAEDREDGRGLMPLPLVHPPGGEQMALLRAPDLHFKIAVDRLAQTLAIDLNGQPFAAYRDPRPQAPPGGHVIFSSFGGGFIRLSGIRVRAWNGLATFSSEEARRSDLVRLVDGKTKSGVVAIADGQVEVNGTRLPWAQVEDVALRANDQVPPQADSAPWALLWPAGQLRLALQPSTEQALLGAHVSLGEVAIPWKWLAGVVNPRTLANAGPLDRASFANGDSLQGRLAGWTTDGGLAWRMPTTDAAIAIRGPRLKFLHLAGRAAPPAKPAPALVTVKQHDHLAGVLRSMNDTAIVFDTEFAGPFEIDRAAVDRIDLRREEEVIWEGPGGTLEGWKPSNRLAWHMADGVLVAKKMGGLGREMDLPARGRIDLHLSWDDHLALSVAWLTSDLAKPVAPGGYLLMGEDRAFTLYRGLEPDEVAKAADVDPLRNRRLEEQLEDFQARFGRGPTRKIGSAIPATYDNARRERRLTICWSQATREISALMDGQLLTTWKDEAGFSQLARGFVLWHHSEISTLRISHLSVRHWNGVLPEADPRAANAAEDWLRLRNQDELRGRLLSLGEGVARIESSLGLLEIPQERLATIILAQQAKELPVRHGMVLQGEFHRGGGCLFFLERADDREMLAWSPYWGERRLPISAFRELRFDQQDQDLWKPGVPWIEPLPVAMRALLPAALPPTAEAVGAEENGQLDH